ncbi:MAG: hypothetical protein H8E10_09220 [Desulfobacterales bacterium]|nr:hypothetical protein [Desulfobacterales bacterium]
MKYQINVNCTEDKQNGNSYTESVGHDYYKKWFDSYDNAVETAEGINLDDFSGHLLTDFHGISGSVEVEVVSIDDDGDIQDWAVIKSARLEFAPISEFKGAIIKFDDKIIGVDTDVNYVHGELSNGGKHATVECAECGHRIEVDGEIIDRAGWVVEERTCPKCDEEMWVIYY